MREEEGKQESGRRRVRRRGGGGGELGVGEVSWRRDAAMWDWFFFFPSAFLCSRFTEREMKTSYSLFSQEEKMSGSKIKRRKVDYKTSSSHPASSLVIVGSASVCGNTERSTTRGRDLHWGFCTRSIALSTNSRKSLFAKSIIFI